MKTDIQNFKAADLLAAIAKAAPSVCVETLWEHDDDAKWDVEGDLDQDDFQAWQSEVRASAIVDGKLISGSAYLGGGWEKYGDNPAQSNPEISGYLPQMLAEALAELRGQVSITNRPLRLQIDAAEELI